MMAISQWKLSNCIIQWYSFEKIYRYIYTQGCVTQPPRMYNYTCCIYRHTKNIFECLAWINWQFLRYFAPLCQNEFHLQVHFSMWIKLIFIWKASHEDLFWNWGTRQLGNGLLYIISKKSNLDAGWKGRLPEGWGTPLYGLNGDVWPARVCFSGMYLFYHFLS